MSKQNKQWAVRERARILTLLGGMCYECDEDDPEELDFDCKIPQGDTHHRGSTDQRMCFYRKQLAAENLQILCKTCHGEKSRRDKEFHQAQEVAAESENPF